MNVRPFLDTNIVIYAFQQGADPRTEIARDLLRDGGVISVHVLNEFASVARRKLRMTWQEVSESLSAVRLLCADPRPLTVAPHEAALNLSVRYGYDIYDSLVIASALEAGCEILYSEDMQNDQQIRDLTIRNPFSR